MERASVLVAGLFTAQDVVDVENVIAVFIIVTVILDTLARFG